MTPELKAKWVAALCSGKFAQGHGKIEGIEPVLPGDGDKTPAILNCCLGVLCKISLPDDDIYDSEFVSKSDENLNEYGRDEFSLSLETMEKLIVMNDGYEPSQTQLEEGKLPEPPMTFLEIADWIEANL